mgnify:CR=1 FL=1
MNAVMVARGRPKLTQQAIMTITGNSPNSLRLTVVDDDGTHGTLRYQCALGNGPAPIEVAIAPNQDHVLGFLKNFGVEHGELLQFRSPDGLLYLSDNDAYFTPGWYERMTTLLPLAEKEGFRLLGGQNHPYHLPIAEAVGGHVREYNAIAGTSWLMTWKTWDEFGPLVETGGPGIGKSEDGDFCAKIRAAGYRVGAVWPPVVYDCGITNTDGKRCPGAEHIKRHEGVIYE